MSHSAFYQIKLPLEKNIFNDLLNSATFEPAGKGRMGNHLVKIVNEEIPVVRTTTKYSVPANAFSDIHNQLVAMINTKVSADHPDIPIQNFNNALIEVYHSAYSKMNFHSDQALDLDDDSFIALFSCYENPDEIKESHLRKLVIKDKITNEESEMILDHNSVILFSIETNRKFQHKIILSSGSGSKTTEENRWLGITFRTSKTLIRFKDHLPYFSTGELFKLADQEQESAFFQLRGQENRKLDFIYPDLPYTISPGDLLTPLNNYNIK